VYLGDHVFERLHDLGALGLLEVGEAAGDDDHSRQNDPQIQLQSRGQVINLTSLDFSDPPCEPHLGDTPKWKSKSPIYHTRNPVIEEKRE